MRFLLILILVFAAASAVAQRELTTIAINYASAPQLVTVIKPYLSDGSSVSAYQNQLVLNVTPQELAKTRELLQQLDAAGRQLLVSVRTDATGTNSGRGIDIDGVVRSGDTVITTGTGRRNTQSHTTVRVENYSGSRAGGGNQAVRATGGTPPPGSMAQPCVSVSTRAMINWRAAPSPHSSCNPKSQAPSANGCRWA